MTTNVDGADFAAKLVGRLLTIQFRRALTLESLERCIRCIATSRATCGKRLCFVAVIPEGLPPLPTPIRRAVTSATPAMLEDCESVDIVLMGGGLMHGLTRTVMRGMIVASRSRDRIFLHDSLDSASSRLRRSGVGEAQGL